ncbi:M20/M25/M40 family metallo-hydrolase [Nocardioides sp.]|uniref:M20/M25/M40 family metallo-hydrolase n=1 Tax=Nocardioides sp. TaxID=35761 RepID=UPI002C35AD72|nr:M20/M25/M40 family metallo-hydrolase [Nocardioides sp.]HXH80162.1 M20/M25/M40 family metallo-hydrolase [Nocardioides sp.]
MHSTHRRPLSVAVLVGSLAAVLPFAATAAPQAPSGSVPSSAPAPRELSEKETALAAGDAVAEQGLGALGLAAGEDYVRSGQAQGPRDLYYLSYQKTFKGLEVVGADAVVTTNAEGEVVDISAASQQDIAVADTTPKVTGTQAIKAARSGFSKVESAVQHHVVVLLEGTTTKLAWEIAVEGTRDGKPSVQDVFVDAQTGAVLRRHEYVRFADATGNGNHNGQVRFTTTGSGSSYSMTSTATSGLKCGGQSGTVYTDADNAWGNGSGTDLPTACVDAMYAGEQEAFMLKEWANRDGVDGSGSFFPSRVGLNEVNAFWNGQYANFGKNQAGTKQVTPIDVVAHEYGHGVFQFSGSGGGGSGAEMGGMNESTGDILGAATECYAAAKFPSSPDKCDYEVGEMVNLVGQGPIRIMSDPSKLGDPNCATQITSSTEVHAAAGPQNHWFYLLAEGSNPANGQPTSPICSGGPTTITGIGIQKATNIFVNGLQRKTSTWNHKAARVATLNAAKTLYPSSCVEFNAVKNAWLGAGVPVQTGEPTCSVTTPTNDYSVSLSPASGSVQPGASVSATVNTQTTAGSAQSVSFSTSGLPSGATVSFNPTSVQTGSSSSMAIQTAASTPTGTYTVTVTASGNPIKTATYSLAVGSSTPQPSTPPDIDVAKAAAHMTQFQTIATNNGGNRRAGTAGYTASADYVVAKLQAAGFTVSRQRCTTCTYPSDNVIADWPGGDATKTYMFGAHLDGVSAGPGINDNGSGSAGILEVALTLAEKKPQMLNHVRFAWWTDEEQGLNGSKFYVNNLTTTARSQIKAYYNFDMIASVNAGYFINNITSAQSAPMKAYYDSLNLQPEENVEGRGRSDDYSFSNAGIPASGYAMGASATKTSAQASKWGGTAGRAYDPCYHSACDSNPANVSTTALNRAADGIAHTLWKMAVGEAPPTENDFSIAVSPTSGSVVAGSSATATVSTAVTSGTAQQVSLTASGAPAGTTVSFSPSTVQSGGTAQMTVQTSATTPSGTYPITVTGTGSATRTATFTLTVTGGGGGGATYLNGTDYQIYDNSTLNSPISSTYAQQVSSAKISYDIYHSCVQDVDVWLVSPNGVAHQVETSSASACVVRDGIVEKTVIFSSPVAANGTWRLRIRDNYSYDTGTLYSWRLTLP